MEAYYTRSNVGEHLYAYLSAANTKSVKTLYEYIVDSLAFIESNVYVITMSTF